MAAIGGILLLSIFSIARLLAPSSAGDRCARQVRRLELLRRGPDLRRREGELRGELRVELAALLARPDAPVAPQTRNFATIFRKWCAPVFRCLLFTAEQPWSFRWSSFKHSSEKLLRSFAECFATFCEKFLVFSPARRVGKGNQKNPNLNFSESE